MVNLSQKVNSSSSPALQRPPRNSQTILGVSAKTNHNASNNGNNTASNSGGGREMKTQDLLVKIADIVIPDWYPKKFVSNGEINKANQAIKDHRLGIEPMVIQYNRELSKYNLIQGLVTYKAHLELKTEKVTALLLDEKSFSVTDVILASTTFNTGIGLNKYESTKVVIKYLEKKLDLHPITRSEKRGLKTVTYTIDATDQITNMMVALVEKRKELKKKEKNRKEEVLKKAETILIPGAEEAIDLILATINVDISYFVNKQLIILTLPYEIILELDKGSLSYSKAAALSRLGTSYELKFLQANSSQGGLKMAKVRRQVDNARADLLDRILEENLTVAMVNKEVITINNRIYLETINLDEAGLADIEISQRKNLKDDLILKERISAITTKANNKCAKYDFLEKLGSIDRSRLEKAVRDFTFKIEKIIEDVEKQKTPSSNKVKTQAQ